MKMFRWFKKKEPGTQAKKKEIRRYKVKKPEGTISLVEMAEATGLAYQNLYMHYAVGTLHAKKAGRMLYVTREEYTAWLDWFTSPRKAFHGRQIIL